MNWFTQSILATALLAPCWLAIGFFERNFGIKPNIFVVWYFVGISLSVATYIAMSDNQASAKLFPSFGVVLAIILVGATIGAAANVLLFTAVAHAPNPSFPSVIANGGGGALVFLLAIVLGTYVPKYFAKSEVNWINALAGIAFIVAGIFFLANTKR